jgi:Kef-type K+ transport system membrane component KefB
LTPAIVAGTLSGDQVIARLLLVIALTILAVRTLGVGLRRVGQQPVMAEILTGVALGPSLLGAVPGGLYTTLFPTQVRAALSAVGGVGLVLFVFIVALGVDAKHLGRGNQRVPAITCGSVALPFALGIALAFLLYRHHRVVLGHVVPFVAFALFVATSLSITAFPVLTRILRERQMDRGPLGSLIIASAAAQDFVAWVLMAVALAVLSVAGPSEMLRLTVEMGAFVAGLVLVVRPLLKAFLKRQPGRPGGQINTTAIVVAGLAASAGITQLIGLHSVIGAFLFGLAFPREGMSDVGERLERALQPLTLTLLLPLYFLGAGLEANLRLIGDTGVTELGPILVCACAGKLVGAAVGARLSGLRGREVGVVAALMNTRGLVELIVLRVGLSAGVLDRALFSELVLMALVTTMMTGPLLDAIAGRAYGPARLPNNLSLIRR